MGLPWVVLQKMNSYKYKPSTIVFDERVKHTLSKLQSEYNFGKSMTKSEYAYKVKQAVFEFYKSMGKPTYEFTPASDVPSFVHYKNMIESAASDMSQIIKGCEYINGVLNEMDNVLLEETSVINDNVSMIDFKIKEIENRIKSISSASSMILSDSFEFNDIDTDDESTKNLSHADVSEGLCQIAATDTISSNDFEVSILETSNGFPGNTHEVYDTMDGVKYIGEVDPRISIHSVTSKDKKDWFEFEMYNLDNEVRMKTSSVGFKYKEGISWIKEDNELNLDLKITFRTPRILNILRLNGIPKVNYQTEHPIIKEIIIKDDYAGIQVIKYGDYLLENTTIQFKPQVVKEVIIKISQRDNVVTKVARNYTLSIDPTKMPYFFNDEYKDFTQIDKPTISIEALGLSYNKSDKSIIYPSTTSSNSFLNKEYTKANLFYSTNNTTDNSKLFTDVINAYRYRIGISYIGFEYKQYSENGVYISKSFESENPIKKVTLNAYDKIPGTFYTIEQDEKEKDKPFIAYYLSFNNEEEWHRIYPRTLHSEGPCSIVINSFLNVESRSPNVTYIDTLMEYTRVRLRIELRRPIEVIDESPIVNEYNLDIDGEE